MRPSVYLGPRLGTILGIVKSAQQEKCYDRIWDCCCDHGYLGIAILELDICRKLVFVDQVPHITESLQEKLKDPSFRILSDKYEVITGDASMLSFSLSQRHLVILSGVSGKNVIAIIKAILCKQPDATIDFLICPTNALYDVREYLRECDLLLVNEQIVMEKKRHYEVIYVCCNEAGAEGVRVSLTGQMWESGNVDHERYMAKITTHHQRVSRAEDRKRSEKILLAYQSCCFYPDKT